LNSGVTDMLKISWKDKVPHKNVLEKMHFILHFTRIVRQKLAYAGHVFRESIGLNALLRKGNLKQGSKRKAQKDMD